MNKHAYLIVANSNWKVVNTCLKLIDDIRNDIYLLIDKKTHLTKHQIDGLKSICKESKLRGYSFRTVSPVSFNNRSITAQ